MRSADEVDESLPLLEPMPVAPLILPPTSLARPGQQRAANHAEQCEHARHDKGR